jgi:chemotaxis protein CheY-P-specific phosphatase CheC
MCSVKPPNLFSPDAADAVKGAIASVAERSFFADVQSCDHRRFDDLASGAESWLVATVHFREGEIAGVLSCTLPHDLARNLLDAFTGRDPREPEPDGEALFDLVGELSNMICGTWLTRMATAQTFTLSRPVVELSPVRPPVVMPGSGAAALMAVNDLPLAVSVSCVTEDAAAASGF